MGFIQRVGDLRSVAQHLIHRQRSARQPVSQALALQILHHQIVGALLRADVIKVADVGVGELRDGTRLALEALLQVGTGDEVSGKNFDGHVAAQPGIASAVHLAHAAGT